MLPCDVEEAEMGSGRPWSELEAAIMRNAVHIPGPVVRARPHFLSRFGSLVIVGGIVVVVTGVLCLIAVGQM